MTEFLAFLTDLVKVLIPAALVLYGMYIVLKGFMNRDLEAKLVQVRAGSQEKILPLRLQAYERMALFLERISPSNLLLRVNEPGYTVHELQQLLGAEIRNEFAHNLSQQIYMTSETWENIRAAKEELISIINMCASQLPADANSMELVQGVVQYMMADEKQSIPNALQLMKAEIQKIF